MYPEKTEGSPPCEDSVPIPMPYEIVNNGEQKVADEGQDDPVMSRPSRNGVIPLAAEPIPDNEKGNSTASPDGALSFEAKTVPLGRYPTRERRQPAYLKDYGT